jgi:hypothetical protein
LNTFQKIISTAWENSAIAHAKVFEKIADKKIIPKYSLPPINLAHLKKMTDEFGIIQFSKINQPDLSTGYTLDDNARALIAMCMHFELTANDDDLPYIRRYFNFIKYCLKPSGYFQNYVDKNRKFTEQNRKTNLDDSNGRAIWALGYVVSLTRLLPQTITSEAENILQRSLRYFIKVHSTRSMAFAIKGICFSQSAAVSPENIGLLKTFANRLVQMYKHEASENWEWFESYLTYANSLLPEAMLNAWLLTGDPVYKEIAIESFDFLLSKIFNKNGIEVISNNKWLQKGREKEPYGEQPIDVAYTILT